MNKYTLPALMSVITTVSSTAAQLPLSDEVALPKARAVLAKLTLEQKVQLLGGWHTMYLTDIPSAGIDRKWAMSDSTSGIKPEHSRWQFTMLPEVDNRSTVLPCGSALAMTWNRDLAAAHGHVMGEQMRDRGKDQMLGPGVNINRTPLCGRNWEYLSEDPYLNARMVAPMIKAVQSHGVATTVKHFCVNNQELDRKEVDTVVDERTLHEIYFPAFRAAIRDGGSLAVMTSYNRFNGTFVSENSYLQRGILRDRWGFLGQIVSDWGGQHSTVPAALNGASLEMNYGAGIVYFTNWKRDEFPLLDAVQEGKVPEAVVDDMVLRVLYVMAKTGWLDKVQDPGCRFTDRHHEIARTIGEESMVLLRNKAGVLPLDRAKIRKLVVLGLSSDRRQCHLGSSACCTPEYEITALQGLIEYLGPTVDVELFPLGDEIGAKGSLDEIPNDVLESYREESRDAFAERAWKCSLWDEDNETADWSTQPDSVEYVDYPEGDDCSRIRYESVIRPQQSGTYAFSVAPKGTYESLRIYVDDGLVGLFNEETNDVRSVFLTAGKDVKVRIDAIADDEEVEFELGWRLPDQMASSTKDKETELKSADAVLVFTGSELGWGQSRESEGGDMPNMNGAPGHDKEIARLLKRTDLRNLVVLHRSGSQMLMPWADSCPTLLHCSYLGQEAGRAIARTLFGAANPSGRLAASWPRRYEDLGVAQMGTYGKRHVIYNERFYVGYRWFDARKIEPLFPFGYGLSYTTFEQAPATVERQGDGWRVSVKVTNVGKVAGKEVVQLYMQPVEAAVERCARELKGFAKTRCLQPGESETLVFEVSPRDCAYYDVFPHRWRALAGEYDFVAAASSRDLKSSVRVRLERDVVFDE